MPDHVVGLDPAGAQRFQHGETRRHERRLLHLGLDHLVERGVEAQPPKIEPARLASLLVHLHRLRNRLGDISAHSLRERPLSGEAKRDLHHASVHLINADPHVNPAPIPVIRIIDPSCTRPSSTASANASGIEADEVLP